MLNVFELVSSEVRRIETDDESKITRLQSIFSFIDYSKLSMFQISYIPGPLQSYGYIRGIFRAEIFPSESLQGLDADLESAIQERVRQGVNLRESDKYFDFLIHENAFRMRVCSHEQMIDQIESIKVYAKQSNIEIGVIPSNLNYLELNFEPPQISFDIFDEKFLLLQGNMSPINVWEEEMVFGYSTYFQKLKQSAVTGDKLIAKLDSTIRTLEIY